MPASPPSAQVLYRHKVVVVTGASSGIGRALCLALAPQQPRLVLAARNEERLSETARECIELGAEVLVAPTDLASVQHCQVLTSKIMARFGALDVLVHAAGIGMRAAFAEIADAAMIEALTRVNYLGAVYLTYFALPHLLATRGQIVVVGSLASFAGVPGLSLYAGSKHALLGFFDSLRLELAGDGIRITTVAPDFVATRHRANALGPDGRPLDDFQGWSRSAMSAEICAERIVTAMSRARPLVITSWRGRLLRWGRLLAPRVADALVVRAIRRGR